MLDFSEKSRVGLRLAFWKYLQAKETSGIQKNDLASLDVRDKTRGVCVRKWHEVGKRAVHHVTRKERKNDGRRSKGALVVVGRGE